MNSNLQCPEILQMTKMTLIINKNYQDSCKQGAARLTGCRIMTVKNQIRFWKLAIVGS